uniref:Uncharacterized protein n=1 Tax=Triticum urartu TaxID=4572 RepID=A0A8R7U5H2_TRIUA
SLVNSGFSYHMCFLKSYTLSFSTSITLKAVTFTNSVRNFK